MLRRTLLAGLAALLLTPSTAQERFITLASTTSMEQSGLLGHILPLFRQQTGIEVRVAAVGTGQALQIGMKGEADALLVHDSPGEERFVAEGHGLDRREVMFNDLIMSVLQQIQPRSGASGAPLRHFSGSPAPSRCSCRAEMTVARIGRSFGSGGPLVSRRQTASGTRRSARAWGRLCMWPRG